MKDELMRLNVLNSNKIRLRFSLQLAVALAFTFAGKANSSEQPLNQYLEMDLSQLMQVTVTSVAKKKQSLADTAAAVFVITQDDIKKSGATTVPDVLSLAPGIHVAQISASKWSVSSRGFTGLASNKLLILIDGRTVYSPAYSGTFWDMQNVMLEDIDRIEVIRGPGGTIWGANAVNGVINIITKSSSDTRGGLVRASVGSHEKYSAAARYGGELSETTSARIYAMTTDHDSFQLHSDGTDSKDDWNNYQAGFRADGTPVSSLNWTLHGDVYKNDGEELLYPYWHPGPPFLSMEQVDFDSEGANLNGGLEKTFAPGRVLRGHMYYDYTSRDEDFLIFEYHTYDLDLQYDHQFDDTHTFTFGTGYRYITGDFEDTFQYNGPDDSYQIFSGFIQDRITFIQDKLSATVGTKWENNDFTGNEWQPSASLLYKPKDNHSIWLAAARAVRTPSFLEDGGNLVFATYPTEDGVAQIRVVGNSAFESEEVYTYEAGYRWQPVNEISADLTVFYSDYDDLYSFLSAEGGQTQTIENQLEAESYGFELSLKWHPTRELAFDLAYSYLELDFTGAASETLIIAQVIESTAPQHQVSLHGSWNMTKTLQLNGWLKYQSATEGADAGTFFNNAIDVDEFFTLDLNLAWKPMDDLEIALVGQNLLDDSRLQYVSESLSPAIEVEREVFLKLTYAF